MMHASEPPKPILESCCELHPPTACGPMKCPACDACPEVILDVAKDEVRIGEEGHLVHLSNEAWNTLVEKIQQGELSKL